MKRRQVLQGLAVASLAATAAACAKSDDASKAAAASSDDNGEDEHIVEYLFVQNAASAVLNGGTLALAGVPADTLYFSNRPDRIAGRMPTQHFVDEWATGDDSFSDDPPNAVLSVLSMPEPKDVVVTLGDPTYDGDVLTYPVTIIDGPDSLTGEASALFIDVVGRPLTPVSVAGVSRRTSRRTTRRVEGRNGY